MHILKMSWCLFHFHNPLTIWLWKLECCLKLWGLEPHPRYREVESWTRLCFVQHQSHCTPSELSTSECLSEKREEKKSLFLEITLFWIYEGLSDVSFLGKMSSLLNELQGERNYYYFCEHCHIWSDAGDCSCHLAPAYQPKDKVIIEAGSIN